MSEPLLDVVKLKTMFHNTQSSLTVVDEVSFQVYKGEIIGIVGESGSGKSMMSLSIMGLLPSHAASMTAERLQFLDMNMLDLKPSAWCDLRGNRISMIFQEPMTSLNPSLTIGQQIDESIRIHRKMSKIEARKQSLNLLRLVGIADAEHIVNQYPHHLSGGMRQRIMIAMAISCQPDLLIADEPTTALDVTTQAQILDEIQSLQQATGMSVILVTHDLGIIAGYCQRVLVMYAGQIVESASVERIFSQPRHPYTKALLRSIPTLIDEREELEYIPGQVPIAGNFGPGCRFAQRCHKSNDQCHAGIPPVQHDELDSNHTYRCWFPEGGHRDDIAKSESP